MAMALPIIHRGISYIAIVCAQQFCIWKYILIVRETTKINTDYEDKLKK